MINFFLGLLLLRRVSQAQTTGVVSNLAVTEGVTLFNPLNGVTTYLIDNEGNELYSWTDNDLYVNAGPAYLSSTGTLIKGVRTPSDFFAEPDTSGGSIREYDDLNVCVWEFRYSNTLYRITDVFIVLPNGNLLIAALENHPYFDTQLKGYVGARSSAPEGYWSSTLIEVPPSSITQRPNEDFDPDAEDGDGDANNTCMNFSDELEAVWKWDLFDHASSEISISTWDINLPFEIDGIDYISSLDQITIDCGICGEVFIIDRSITPTESQGRLGDFIYRWGNPANYGQRRNRRLETLDRKLEAFNLFFVGDNYGWTYNTTEFRFMIFNNRDPDLDGDSSILQIQPTYNGTDWEPDTNGTFLPVDETFAIAEVVEEIITAESEICLYYGYHNNWGKYPYGYNYWHYNNWVPSGVWGYYYALCDKDDINNQVPQNRNQVSDDDDDDDDDDNGFLGNKKPNDGPGNSNGYQQFSKGKNFYGNNTYYKNETETVPSGFVEVTLNSTVYGFAQMLPNENIISLSSGAGEISEIESNNQVTWKYISPFYNTNKRDGVKGYDQKLGDNDSVEECSEEVCTTVVSAIRYSLDHPGVSRIINLIG